MKKKGLILCSLLLSFSMFGQFTLIPDNAFELFLVNEGIDTDGIINGQVLTSDIEDETTLIIDGFGITDMTGLEDFTSLEDLSLVDMFIPTLNISQNSNLGRLTLSKLPITNLDLSSNLNLWDLSIGDLPIDFLNLTNNILLSDFNLSLNAPFGAYPSNLSDLNLSQNLLLETPNISFTQITHLNFSLNVDIRTVNIRFMPELQTVNLSNGNNENIIFLQIDNNPNLDCLQVDDPIAVMAGTDPPYDNWMIENNPTITDDCQLGVVDYLKSQVKLYPNPVASKLFIQLSDRLELETVRVYDLMGKGMLETKGSSELDVSLLSKGVYLVSITTNKGTLTQKLIKE